MMRKGLLFGILLLAGLVIFVFYTFISTGYFRTITPFFEGVVLKKVRIAGAEDITISSQDSFAIISATDRRMDPKKQEGALYYMDLRSGDFVPLLLTGSFQRPLAPHGIALYRKDSTYVLLVVNHGQGRHTLEKFELSGLQLTHLTTFDHPSLIHPNDVVFLDEERFYFTNDHRNVKGVGRLIEDYGGMAWSNVIYYDGETFREVADGIAYANGIARDPDRNLLYVASPRHFLIRVYTIRPSGDLVFVEDIPCATGVDNIELDPEGVLWVGAHPNLLHFTAYAKGKKAISPSEVIRIEYRNKGDYMLDQIYVEDGSTMSGSTVAAPFGSVILVGNVMDEKFLVLERRPE